MNRCLTVLISSLNFKLICTDLANVLHMSHNCDNISNFLVLRFDNNIVICDVFLRGTTRESLQIIIPVVGNH